MKKKLFIAFAFVLACSGIFSFTACSDVKISSISAELQSDYVVYVGDTFDNSKVIVTAYFDNNTSKIIENNVGVIFGVLDTSTAGEKDLNITYQVNQDKSLLTTLKVNVIGIEVKISSISAELQSDYVVYVGDTFDNSKVIVTAYFDNNTSKIIENNVGVNFGVLDTSTAGEKDLNITYQVNQDKSLLTTLKVNVIGIEVKISSISAELQSDYVVYVGDTFDNSKVIVTAHFDNNTSKIIENNVGVIFGVLDTSTAGEKDLNITYQVNQDKSLLTTLKVNVIGIDALYLVLNDGNVVYTSDSNNVMEIKTKITVIAHYSNNTEKDITNYIINITDNTFIVKYQNIESNSLTMTPVELEDISVVLKDNCVINSGDDTNTIKSKILVTACYNNNTKKDVKDYTISPSNAIAVDNMSFVITYEGKTINLITNVSVEKNKPITNITPPKAIDDLKYNGQNQWLITPGNADGGIMKYSLDNENYSTDIPQGKNAGNYTVWYKVIGDDNHIDTTSKSVITTIRKAVYDMEGVSFNDAYYTYDGNPRTFVISGTLPNGVVVSYSPNILNGVGEITVTATFTGNSKNYEEIPPMEATFTVIEKELSVLEYPSPKTNLVYNGNEQELVNAGSVENGEILFSLNNEDWYGSIPTKTNAGDYTVWYKVDGFPNFKDILAQKIECKISKIDPSFITKPLAKTDLIYDEGENPLITAGEVNGGEIQYSLDNENYSTDIPQGKNAGNYIVWYKVIGDDNHNNTAPSKLQVTIKEQNHTPGLIYELHENNAEYIIIGIDNEESTLITELVVPRQYKGLPVYTIKAYAFANWDNLKSVTIFENIKMIGENAFENCPITTARIPANLVEFIPKDNLNIVEIISGEKIFDDTFKDCKKLGTITLSNSITEIGKSAFSGCTGLIDVNFGRNVSKIGANAFSGCTALQKIEIPESVMKIDSNAFLGCTLLGKVEIRNLVKWCDITFADANANPLTFAKDLYLFNETTSQFERVTKLVIPAEVSRIRNYVFYNCVEFTSIKIAENVLFIENEDKDAFKGCVNVKIMEAPFSIIKNTPQDSLEEATVVGGGSMPGRTFTGKNLRKITLNEGITSLYGYNGSYSNTGAIHGCESLEKLIIYGKDENINVNYYSFSGTNNIKEATVPAHASKFAKENLQKIFITNGNIPDDSFKNCTALTTVKIGKDVTSIGDRAFYGCSALSDLTFEDGSKLKKIGANAFSGCILLETINLPESVTHIGKEAFEQDSADSKNYKATKWYSDQENGVVYAGNVLYKYKGTMPNNTTLALNEKTKGIADYALANQTNLKSITLNSGLLNIGKYAFSGCTLLESVTLPENVLYIGEHAFDGCNQLTSVNIPEVTESIGLYAFANCTNLSSATVGESNTRYKVEKNCIIETATNTLIYACNNESIIIPTEVKNIAEGAFAGCDKLTAIDIPEGVQIIGKNAFSDCTNLNDVSLPNGLTPVDNSAFSGCTRIETATLPINAIAPIKNVAINTLKNVIIIGTEGVPTNAFHDCTALESVTISNTITGIGKEAFCGCSALKSVIFEEDSTMTTIYDSAFYNCTALTEFVIPNSVTSLDIKVFYNCSNLESITIGTGVASIGYHAFGEDASSSCKKLEKVNIYDLEKWCKIVFAIPNNENKYYSFTNPLEIAKDLYLFNETNEFEKVTELAIPNTITEIKPCAFFGYSANKITIPNSVTKIGKFAFYGCDNLTAVEIPQKVEFIGRKAFANCDSLETLSVAEGNLVYHSKNNCLITNSEPKTLIMGCKTSVIPEEVTHIAPDAFHYCLGLTSIVIPANITNIGASAFAGCKDLAKVQIDNLEKWCNITFADDYSNPLTLAKDLYLKDEGETYTQVTELVIPATVTEIKNFAFYNADKIKSVKIPNISLIGKESFAGCTGIETATIPANKVTVIPKDNLKFVTITGAGTIPQYAFSSSSIEKVIIEEGVTGIGYATFESCSNLKEVVIPDSVTTIDNCAFNSANNIITATIPAVAINKLTKTNLQTLTITSGKIPENAFAYCENLSQVTIGNDVTSIGAGAFTGTAWLNNLYQSADDNSVVYANLGDTNKIALALKGTISGELTLDTQTKIIAGGVFENQTGLTKINIPESVTSIGKGAFTGCTNLEEIFFAGTVAQWEALIANSTDWNTGIPDTLTNVTCFDDIWSFPTT